MIPDHRQTRSLTFPYLLHPLERLIARLPFMLKPPAFLTSPLLLLLIEAFFRFAAFCRRFFRVHKAAFCCWSHFYLHSVDLK
ncbi:hypothetical protein L596_020179 [Steinernema carpocapsae]|uniref:Uncharacterized protein n=1 Tax=Steinernema carpocapsae TaxID=34508 RepID=A0A4U5MSR8_STECR|nr:hypothetical protein L596_020179 [Steinernema carpocapsae]